jgi:F subunit of K+-transporting ATPase (Potass_KdpF)
MRAARDPPVADRGSHVWRPTLARHANNRPMTIVNGILLAVSVAAFCYLGAAIFLPERF